MAERVFREVKEEGSTLLVSRRIKLTEQDLLVKKFFEQMKNGESGVVYNAETGELEDTKAEKE